MGSCLGEKRMNCGYQVCIKKVERETVCREGKKRWNESEWKPVRFYWIAVTHIIAIQ
jgi:hypothetical protein